MGRWDFLVRGGECWFCGGGWGGVMDVVLWRGGRCFVWGEEEWKEGRILDCKKEGGFLGESGL